MKLTALIITFNEEKNIGTCLDSLSGIADEIIVIDSFSTDNTEIICKAKGAIFIQNKFEGHIEQKNFAVSKATHDYVLSLDADEALSPELAKEILKVKNNRQYDGYEFNRLTNYCGKWVKHCGWYPDRKLRLWNKTKGRWGGSNPHDQVLIEKKATVGLLKGDLLHYSYHSIHDHVKQANYFTDITSREAFLSGKRSNIFLILISPLVKFIKSYFIQLGILDGYYGFLICIISSHATFLKYIKLKELQKKN